MLQYFYPNMILAERGLSDTLGILARAKSSKVPEQA